MPLPPPLRGARAAMIFLTRIPVGGRDYRDADWQWSTGWFPFVGALIGFIVAAIWMVATPLGPWPSSFIVIGLGMLITGGFHEDGLADTADALGGAFDRERLLTILKDSRVGAFGAMALFCALGLRASLLVGLDTLAPIGLVLSECLSRAAAIWLMAFLPYVTDDEASKSRQVVRAGAGQVLLASLWPVLLMGAALFFEQVPTMKHLAFGTGACVLVTLYCGWRFKRRAGGLTGDFLGATQQLAQLGILAGLLWASHG